LTYHGAESADAHVDELECGEEEAAAANRSEHKPRERTPGRKEDKRRALATGKEARKT
jgi:hypothetical protein